MPARIERPYASSGLAMRSRLPEAPAEPSARPGGRSGASGATTRIVKASRAESCRALTRTSRSALRGCVKSSVRRPRRLVMSQASEVSWERSRRNTSTAASRSPAASSSSTRSRAAAGPDSAYQTEPSVKPAHEPGSFASLVASTVVPRTVEGSAPRFWAFPRSSLGGGAASAAAGAINVAAKAMRTMSLGMVSRTDRKCG